SNAPGTGLLRSGRATATTACSSATHHCISTTSSPAPAEPDNRTYIPIAQEPDARRGPVMDITIIGTGNMARGIATRALAGGHTVTLLGHEPAKTDEL